MNYINKIITESFRQLLTEGAIDDYIKKLIVNNANNHLKPYLNTHVTQIDNTRLVQILKESNPDIFENCVNNPNMGTLKHYLRMEFLNYFDINHEKGPTEFLHGIARIAIEELGFFNDNRDEAYMSLFKQNVMFLHNNPQLVNIQFNKDLNGLDFYDFLTIVNKVRKEFNAQNRINLKSDMINKDYEIVPIMNEEQAKQYAPYVRWCVTRNSYYSYAKSGNRFYFCLRRGFENVPEEVGENCPLDDYGLSMIAVLVDMDGEPVHITTRWNHTYNGEDNPNFKTAEQFQKLLGIDFYNTFVPYTREELKKMGIVLLYEVQDMLDSGVNPKEIFKIMSNSNLDGVFRVGINGKYNFYNSSENKLISKKWFNYVADFRDGLAQVKLGNKWNFLKTNGEILTPNKWYDNTVDFKNGLAVVQLGDKWTYIKTDGKEAFPNQWYDRIGNFNDGFAGVKLGTKWTFINTNGKKAFPNQWYDLVGSFSDGLAGVNLGNKWYFINTNGEEAFPNQYYDEVYRFNDGFAEVKLGDKWFYLDTEGNLWDRVRTRIIKPANAVNEMKIIKNDFYNLFERINRTW